MAFTPAVMAVNIASLAVEVLLGGLQAAVAAAMAGQALVEPVAVAMVLPALAMALAVLPIQVGEVVVPTPTPVLLMVVQVVQAL